LLELTFKNSIQKNFMKKYLLVILLIFTSFAFKTYAQTPVEWSIKLVDVGNNYVELTAMASIDHGWHLVN